MDLVSVDPLFTTTRSLRKRLDLTRSVEADVVQRCIDIALQAPNGGNQHRRRRKLTQTSHGLAVFGVRTSQT